MQLVLFLTYFLESNRTLRSKGIVSMKVMRFVKLVHVR